MRFRFRVKSKIAVSLVISLLIANMSGMLIARADTAVGDGGTDYTTAVTLPLQSVDDVNYSGGNGNPYYKFTPSISGTYTVYIADDSLPACSLYSYNYFVTERATEGIGDNSACDNSDLTSPDVGGSVTNYYDGSNHIAELSDANLGSSFHFSVNLTGGTEYLL
jgi:hypothetical protein